MTPGPRAGKQASGTGLAVVLAPQDREAGLAALAALLHPAPGDLRTFEALGPALADPEAPRVVAICAPAVVDLAQMMAAGLAPTAAMARWRERTGALLADLRRHRRTVTVVDRTALRTPGPEFCAALGTRLGLRAAPPETAADGTAAPGLHPDEPAPLLLALAQMLLASDAKARRLASELEAMMIAERGNGLRDDPAAIAELAFGALTQAQQAEADSTARIELAQSERELMAEQLAVMQGQIAQDLETRTALQASLDQLHAEAEAARTAYQAALDQARTETAAAQAELDQARTETAAAQAALDQVRTEAAAAQAAHEAALAAQTARAEALTRDLLALGQSEEALQAELDLARNTLARARHAETEALARVEQTRRDLAALAQRTERQIAEQGQARAEAEQREAEIRASTSWRITGPLRRLVRLVRRH